ncbi:Gene 25-like lysozyme [uncultured archaeon]|nr:Gene 25-like lysozyme [uncultured archaeon]
MEMYRGFSTISPLSQKKFVLVDNELIKQDLLNILNTKLGERLMYPNFGCVVWNKLFNNLSTTDISDISNNIQSIVSSDPRIALNSLDINQSGNNITLTLVIKYVSTNQLETMAVTFADESTDF